MAITTYLLTITLNGNGLNVPMIWKMGKKMWQMCTLEYYLAPKVCDLAIVTSSKFT